MSLCLGKMQVETAQPLSKLCLEFPDLYIGKGLHNYLGFSGKYDIFFYLWLNVTLFVPHQGCFRESRQGPLVISFEGKVQENITMMSSVISH